MIYCNVFFGRYWGVRGCWETVTNFLLYATELYAIWIMPVNKYCKVMVMLLRVVGWAPPTEPHLPGGRDLCTQRSYFLGVK